VFVEESNFDALMQINLNDLLDNLGLKSAAWARPALARIFRRPIAEFTQLVVDYDRRIGEAGLQAASREIMGNMVREVRGVAIENIPREGPVLFTANHAGLTETLACFSLIPRADLKAMGNDRPFVRLLPHVLDRLVPVPAAQGDRFAVVRQATRHLQAGGALFMNPAGRIEPDPACMPGAIESLKSWSPSIALFIKRVPQAQVVPTLVSGVILPSTLDHPFARVRRTQADRERAAASVQLMIHMRERGNTPLAPTVEFGVPMLAGDLAQRGDATAIVSAITDVMAGMMRKSFGTESGFDRMNRMESE
jgi:hypothetical protein